MCCVRWVSLLLCVGRGVLFRTCSVVLSGQTQADLPVGEEDQDPLTLRVPIMLRDTISLARRDMQS